MTQETYISHISATLPNGNKVDLEYLGGSWRRTITKSDGSIAARNLSPAQTEDLVDRLEARGSSICYFKDTLLH